MASPKLETAALPDPARMYRLNPAVVIEDFGERSLALHCEDLRLVELNATARDLLRRLEKGACLDCVAAAIAADYDQPVDTVLADIREAVTHMIELNMVEVVETVE